MVLDVSGGDSFTDLYGPARFRQIVAPKKIALSLGRPLILLPQTFGPFKNKSCEATAKKLISRATLAFARDPQSFSRMEEILGDEFDPLRHRQGVDLAFGLPAMKPAQLNDRTQEFLAACDGEPIVGINVSGLLAVNAREARTRFNLKGSYLGLLQGLVERLLTETNARLMFVPHVHAPNGHFESDLEATRLLIDSCLRR